MYINELKREYPRIKDKIRRQNWSENITKINNKQGRCKQIRIIRR